MKLLFRLLFVGTLSIVALKAYCNFVPNPNFKTVIELDYQLYTDEDGVAHVHCINPGAYCQIILL